MQTDQILRVRFFHPDGFDDPESLGSDFTTINPLATAPTPTGQRAAALAKCKNKRSKKAKKKCRAKAALLPV